jgi:hypothetical protein
MKPSNNSEELSSNQRMIDLDVHGIVRVRLVNPTACDTAALAKQLGPTQAPLNQEPDIIVRFQERFSTPVLKYLGLNSSAFTDEGFYLLGKNSGAVEARIPFDEIGGQCQIVCRSGLSSVPLLSDIIRLTFLSKNYIPLHASAFSYNGAGILAVGWTKGGKTEALLSFANHDAHYVGDEWVILSNNGQKMFGLPIALAIWDWQFKHIPKLMPKVSLQKKFLFNSIYLLDAAHRTFGRGRLQKSLPFQMLGKALPSIKRQLNIRVLPQEIFENGHYTPAAPLDKVLLLVSHSEPSIRVEAYDPREIAWRMANSNEFEQMDFFEYYRAFKFAFPHRENQFLEEVNGLQRSLLARALEGKEAYKVLHPYPVSFESLFKHLEPICRKAV